MKNIPKISFQCISDEKTKEFEFMNLTNFFARIPEIKLDHDPTRAHRLSFFALLFVTKGTGSHQVDLKEYQLEAGSVLKVAKGQIHAFQENANYEGYLFVFTEEFVINYFSQSSINLILHLYNYHIIKPIAKDKALNEIFLSQLIKELETENAFAQKNIIAALLDLYLLKLERKSPQNKLQSNNSKHYDTFLQFKNLVESNYITTRNVKDYAEMLIISTKLLNQAVKEVTLNTAKAFIDNYVILEAKRAIASTEKSLKEIAFDIGFDEVTNFTKFFKNKLKISPKNFRKQQA